MMTMKNTPHLADETEKTEVQIIEGQEPKDLKHRHLPPKFGHWIHLKEELCVNSTHRRTRKQAC
jgi:hypothetical protein